MAKREENVLEEREYLRMRERNESKRRESEVDKEIYLELSEENLRLASANRAVSKAHIQRVEELAHLDNVIHEQMNIAYGRSMDPEMQTTMVADENAAFEVEHQRMRMMP